MKAGEPDKDDVVPPRGESLAAKILRTRGRRSPAAVSPNRSKDALLVAGLIALGPVLTIAGAQMLTARERAQTARIEAQLAPRTARRADAERTRDQLASVIARPPLATTLDALARALPKEASLVRADRSADGVLQLDVRAPDPDALRGALRRAPAFARLREMGQQRGDAAMIVSWRGEAE